MLSVNKLLTGETYTASYCLAKPCQKDIKIIDRTTRNFTFHRMVAMHTSLQHLHGHNTNYMEDFTAH